MPIFWDKNLHGRIRNIPGRQEIYFVNPKTSFLIAKFLFHLPFQNNKASHNKNVVGNVPLPWMGTELLTFIT